MFNGKFPLLPFIKGGTNKSPFYKGGFRRIFNIEPCIVFDFKISCHACIKATLMKTNFLVFTMN